MVDSGGDVSMDNLSFSPEIDNRRSHARTTPNLWDQALQKLDHIDRQRVDSTRVDHRAVLDDLLKLVAEKQRISVERQWKYTKRNGEVVPIRDVFQNVVNWVKKFREVGDAVAQYDPAHLSLPWAGIRLLLQLAINDSETYGAIVEGVELVSSLVAQYAKVEELYLHSMLAQQQQLEKSITELYMGILSYLSKAMQYYDEGRAGRMAKSLVRGSSSVDKWTKIIVDRAAKVDAIARIIDADFTRKIARFMYGEFQGIHTRFDGLENRLDGLQLSFRVPFPKPTVGLEQVMIWLNPVFAEEEYEMASRLRTPDTCQWIFQRAQYLEWTSPSQNVENPSKTFWVHGPPGFGKTVLCANIVQRLKDDHANSVAYFFCTSDDAIKRQPLAIVRAWVAQMLRQDPIALEVAEDVCRGKDRQPPTTNDIWLMFGEICKSIPNCFFVVDGFDECVKTTRNTKILAHDEGAQFLRELSDASTFTSAHILFVSREDNDLRRHFRKLVDSNPGSVVEYEISPYDTRFDLQAYSTSVVSYTLSKKSVEFQAEMVEEASRRSQGMFLWVRLLGSRLSGGQNAKKLREIIKKTPPSLEKQYDRDLQRIENLGEERERAIAILRWTLFAHRPLTVRELTEALTIDLDDDSDAFPKDDLPDTWEEDEVNDEIRRLCGSLIELRCDNQGGLPQNQTVHFVHSSVRDYLMRSSNTDLSFQAQGVEEDLLARICLRFLMCVHFGNDFTEDDELGHEMFNEYKFLEYASRSWYLHARSTMDWSSSLLQSAVKFFEPSAGRWLPWSKIFKVEDVVVDKNLVVPPPDLRYLSSLFFTSLLGLEHCVQHLLLLQDRAQNADQDASTPLHAASAIGHREIVQLLIQHGATIDAKVKEGWTPLHSAVWNGHFEVVRLLLEQGADIAATDQDGRTPLHSAAYQGHLEVVRLLLEQGADIAATDQDGWTPLHLATYQGHLEVVRLLLEQGADIAATDQDGWTPLHLATYQGHLEVVRLLLEQGADIAATDQDGRTPLHSAAYQGHLEVVRLLLEQGDDIAATDQDGWTPLRSATYQGHLDVIKLLIEQGAELNARNQHGQTLLHLAAESNHIEVLNFLITPNIIRGGTHRSNDLSSESRVDVNVQDAFGRTPLHLALYRGCSEAALALAEHGVDLSLVDGYGRNALEWDSVCEGPLGSTAKWSSIHVLTPECVRVKSLQKSVFLISKELLKSEERPIFPGFHELAHCLMFLNEADDARFCFQRQLIMAEDGSLVHGVYCNACANSPMVGSRFVCKMCPDVDLCDACMRRPIEDRPQTCSKHEFFEISQPILHGSKVGSTDESREDVLAWLGQIMSRYGDGGY